MIMSLCMPQNAPECASEHLQLPKSPGGACPHTPLEWRTTWQPCSLLQLITLSSQLKKGKHSPNHTASPLSPPHTLSHTFSSTVLTFYLAATRIFTLQSCNTWTSFIWLMWWVLSWAWMSCRTHSCIKLLHSNAWVNITRTLQMALPCHLSYSMCC